MKSKIDDRQRRCKGKSSIAIQAAFAEIESSKRRKKKAKSKSINKKEFIRRVMILQANAKL